jgi:hypothetical protein
MYYTEPLLGGMHVPTQKLIGGIYEIRSCNGLRRILYISSFKKIGSGIQTLLGGYTDHRQHADLIRLILFFQNEENRLRNEEHWAYGKAVYEANDKWVSTININGIPLTN